ncbi:hypothetical protein M378DRAFT_168690 [Amanita muscaria Koide BX008]|uniref:Uncharacterized protein n=1 Tax=Amanita muscaria (strain Koide BX008) TaxID=946122 RepID=A0A0C2WEX2_AMAMK|nr:hypothetical protein M378DRAFT_168690 [Amanita muscaria Koide BX008]
MEARPFFNHCTSTCVFELNDKRRHNHLHDIPSIRDVYPHLPEIFGNIDLNPSTERCWIMHKESRMH